MDPKQSKKAKNSSSPADKREERTSLSKFLGLILIAGALFNVPSLLKKPESRADWMMLTLIAAMILGGLILLFFPDWIHKRRNNKNK